MNDPKPAEKLSERDKLVTRPEGELPTALDPAGPESRGYPADPKPGKGKECSVDKPIDCNEVSRTA